MAALLVLPQIVESRKDLGVLLINESFQTLELGSLSDLHAMCSDAMTCNELRKLKLIFNCMFSYCFGFSAWNIYCKMLQVGLHLSQGLSPKHRCQEMALAFSFE